MLRIVAAPHSSKYCREPENSPIETWQLTVTIRVTNIDARPVVYGLRVVPIEVEAAPTIDALDSENADAKSTFQLDDVISAGTREELRVEQLKSLRLLAPGESVTSRAMVPIIIKRSRTAPVGIEAGENYIRLLVASSVGDVGGTSTLPRPEILARGILWKKPVYTEPFRVTVPTSRPMVDCRVTGNGPAQIGRRRTR